MKSLTMKSLTASTALVLVLASGGLALADVRASLSQGRVALGDSFALRLEASGQPNGSAPDLGPLEKDFKIDGTNQTSVTNVINGAVSRSHGWTITLSPKATGNLAIPAIKVGSDSSKPMSIAVVDPATLPRADLASTGLQVDMTVPDGTHYVQQEIPVTVRIMATAGLHDVELSEPSAPDVIVKQSGEDKSHTETIGGRQVSVIERTYLVTPQKSGELVLPPVVLRGQVEDPDAGRSLFGDDDPFDAFRKQFGSGFGRSLLDRMMNQGQEVTARSKPIKLTIAARPGQQASWFLPAKNVELVSQWQPANPVFKVGEANPKIVQLVALGASKEQLPDLRFGDVEGARIYVDRVDDRTVDTEQGTAAIKQYTLSIVPTRAGAVTLPSVEVNWLDTADGKQKTAKLPAETIQVVGAPTAASSSAAPPPAPAASAAASSSEPVPAAETVDSAQLEIFGGSAIALALAAGLALWWRRRRRPDPSRPHDAVSPREGAAAFSPNARMSAEKQDSAASAVRQACKRNDAREAISGLQRWFAASGVNPQTLTSPAAPQFRAAIQELEACLYKETQTSGWDGRALLSAFDAVRKDTGVLSGFPSKTGNLPPLYQGQQPIGRAA